MQGASKAEMIIHNRQANNAKVSACGAFALAAIMGYSAWNVSDMVSTTRAAGINKLIVRVSHYNQPTPTPAQLKSADAAYHLVASSSIKSVAECLNIAGVVGSVKNEDVLKKATKVVNTKILTNCLENVPERDPTSGLMEKIGLSALFGFLTFGAAMGLTSGKSLLRPGKIPQTPTHTAR